MNVEALRRLADVIEGTNRFSLNWYAQDLQAPGSILAKDLTNVCTSVGCVAGWQCAIDGQALLDGDDIHESAQASLGLTDDQANRLFYGDGRSVWAKVSFEFGWSTYDGSGGLEDWSEITASQAATVLRRIADGELVL